MRMMAMRVIVVYTGSLRSKICSKYVFRLYIFYFVPPFLYPNETDDVFVFLGTHMNWQGME